MPFEILADLDRRRFQRELSEAKQGLFKGKSRILEVSSKQNCPQVIAALEVNDDVLISLQIKKPPAKPQ